MAKHPNRNPALSPAGKRATATLQPPARPGDLPPDVPRELPGEIHPESPRDLYAAPEPEEPPFDPAGVNPDDYEWRPVARRPRADGWYPEVQRKFIEVLADSGMVEHAARDVGMSVQSAYRLRRAPGAEGFARAWEAALVAAADRLADLAFQRAVEGEEIPVFDRDGYRVGARWKYNDRLLMFLLRAYRPDRYRHAHEDVRKPEERPAPATIAMAEALPLVGPQTPPDPHLLMEPEDLEIAINTAEAVADQYARDPDWAREKYRYPTSEGPDPRAAERRDARRSRAFDRLVREGRAEYFTG